MKATGNIEITSELTLKDPELSIKKVNYDWETHKVDIEIIFTEGAYKHSRSFIYDIAPDGEMTTDDVLQLIANDPVLKVFS